MRNRARWLASLVKAVADGRKKAWHSYDAVAYGVDTTCPDGATCGVAAYSCADVENPTTLAICTGWAGAIGRAGDIRTHGRDLPAYELRRRCPHQRQPFARPPFLNV